MRGGRPQKETAASWGDWNKILFWVVVLPLSMNESACSKCRVMGGPCSPWGNDAELCAWASWSGHSLHHQPFLIATLTALKPCVSCLVLPVHYALQGGWFRFRNMDCLLRHVAPCVVTRSCVKSEYFVHSLGPAMHTLFQELFVLLTPSILRNAY